MIVDVTAARKRLVSNRLASIVARHPQFSWVLVIVANASSLVSTSLIATVLGVVFWWLAARQFPPAAIGLAAAIASATTLMGTVSMFGFGTLLISELPRVSRSEEGRLVSTSLLFAGAVGAVLGCLFVVGAPLMLGDFRELHTDAAAVAWLALCVGGTPVALILDTILIGRLRSDLQLIRNTAYAVVRVVALGLAMLIPFLPRDAMTIYATIPLANLVSLGLIIRLPQTRAIVTFGGAKLGLLRRIGGSALSHHALNVSIQLPSMVLPVLVTALLSATANAYFYTAWMVANVAFLPLGSLTTTLFAIGAREPAALVSRARLTLMLSLLSAVAAFVILGLTGPLILTIFGKQYSDEAGHIVPLLTVGALPLAIKTHYVALVRIQRRIHAGIIAVAAGAALELIGAGVGGWLGDVSGLCIGWVVALTIEAAWMLPNVWITLELHKLPALGKRLLLSAKVS